MNGINIFGMFIVVLMLVPNVIYALKNKEIENKCKNKFMNTTEQIGRYGSMFFMVFNIGRLEMNFQSNVILIIGVISIAILLILYWAFWIAYLRANKMKFAIMLAAIPSIIFIESGFIFRHYLLIISGVIFAIGHIYVTYQNNKRR